jgi:hypothetical protein
LDAVTDPGQLGQISDVSLCHGWTGTALSAWTVLDSEHPVRRHADALVRVATLLDPAEPASSAPSWRRPDIVRAMSFHPADLDLVVVRVAVVTSATLRRRIGGSASTVDRLLDIAVLPGCGIVAMPSANHRTTDRARVRAAWPRNPRGCCRRDRTDRSDAGVIPAPSTCQRRHRG